MPHRSIACVLAAAALVAVPLAAAPPDTGAAAPPLALTGADGVERSLTAADQPVVVVFYRGVW